MPPVCTPVVELSQTPSTNFRTKAPLEHVEFSKRTWDCLRGAHSWQAMDQARAMAVRRALTAAAPEGDGWVLTGVLSGCYDDDGGGGDRFVRIAALSDPTEEIGQTAKTVLKSAYDATIVGWYALNAGVGVQPLPASMAKMSGTLTALFDKLPAQRPGGLFLMVVVDCVKSHQTSNAHLECYDASNALSCDMDGCWNMDISKLKCVNWSVEE